MADEIAVTLKIEVTNGLFKSSRNSGRVNRDQATVGAQGGVQAIGTSWEAIDLGNVITEGYAYFRNLDATNFVQIGPTGVPVIKLKAGDLCVFPVDPAVTLYAQSDTAGIDLDVMILEA